MENKKAFGRFVRAKRLEAKLTLEQMAELCDMSVRGYADIEVGKSDPKWSTVVKIADALHLDLNRYIHLHAPKKSILRWEDIEAMGGIALSTCFYEATYRSSCIAFPSFGIRHTKNALSPAC